VWIGTRDTDFATCLLSLTYNSFSPESAISESMHASLARVHSPPPNVTSLESGPEENGDGEQSPSFENPRAGPSASAFQVGTYSPPRPASSIPKHDLSTHSAANSREPTEAVPHGFSQNTRSPTSTSTSPAMSSTSSRSSPPPRSQTAPNPRPLLAAASMIKDLGRISYPEGIFGPKPELNVNSRKGKFM
jgi:hypothetical protein